MLYMFWESCLHSSGQKIIFRRGMEPQEDITSNEFSTPTLEWPYSSPISIMGMPCATSRAVAKFLIWRARKRRMLGLRLGPSSPQFQVRLWLSPSLQPAATTAHQHAEPAHRGKSMSGSCDAKNGSARVVLLTYKSSFSAKHMVGALQSMIGMNSLCQKRWLSRKASGAQGSDWTMLVTVHGLARTEQHLKLIWTRCNG